MPSASLLLALHGRRSTASAAPRHRQTKIDAALGALVDSALVGVSALVTRMDTRPSVRSVSRIANWQADDSRGCDLLMTKPITGVALMTLYGQASSSSTI